MNKILIGLAGIFATIAMVLGFKVNDDKKNVEAAKNLLTESENNAGNAQAVINQNREKILTKAASSPAQEVKQEITTETVVPGKVVAQPTTTTTAKKTSSKKTKSS